MLQCSSLLHASWLNLTVVVVQNIYVSSNLSWPRIDNLLHFLRPLWIKEDYWSAVWLTEHWMMQKLHTEISMWTLSLCSVHHFVITLNTRHKHRLLATSAPTIKRTHFSWGTLSLTKITSTILLWAKCTYNIFYFTSGTTIEYHPNRNIPSERHSHNRVFSIWFSSAWYAVSWTNISTRSHKPFMDNISIDTRPSSRLVSWRTSQNWPRPEYQRSERMNMNVLSSTMAVWPSTTPLCVCVCGWWSAGFRESNAMCFQSRTTPLRSSFCWQGPNERHWTWRPLRD